MKIKVKKLHIGAIIPRYQSQWASGFDLHSLYQEIILPGKLGRIHTGLAIQIPRGYELQIRPRSGLSINFPNYIANSPGTIDSDYRGEIMILVINNKYTSWIINRGDRIAQAVICPVHNGIITEVSELDYSERGSGGFGSTGNG